MARLEIEAHARGPVHQSLAVYQYLFCDWVRNLGASYLTHSSLFLNSVHHLVLWFGAIPSAGKVQILC